MQSYVKYLDRFAHSSQKIKTPLTNCTVGVYEVNYFTVLQVNGVLAGGRRAGVIAP